MDKLKASAEQKEKVYAVYAGWDQCRLWSLVKLIGRLLLYS